MIPFPIILQYKAYISLKQTVHIVVTLLVHRTYNLLKVKSSVLMKHFLVLNKVESCKKTKWHICSYCFLCQNRIYRILRKLVFLTWKMFLFCKRYWKFSSEIYFVNLSEQARVRQRTTSGIEVFEILNKSVNFGLLHFFI